MRPNGLARHRIARLAEWIGRALIGALFVAGAVQKAIAPQAAQALLADHGWPVMLVWPALGFNVLGAVCLICGLWLGPMSLLLALYCMITSLFHFLPDDPWQMSIFVKNWAIAGGLLVLFANAAVSPNVKGGAPVR